ncbi:low molecular weight protein tyrosine phosphatase family protein [Uliginosibacterium sp. TH139]|uniref:low molecular weight protein tyrosine phosphatase family protein n=1 Tax=Uliginosibacterium sp. TH139 TaxID=2067453 RepID=UPI000C795C51|nr:low molecular weight protein tyrosine phosphatase family protein [Uliginosibacterium sp. TH139]PLK50526.1 phosphotyrosine protein phosphatase [Uliginosibacterium sp. TH139]
MTNVLFLCSQNKLRSPTAEQVFAEYPGIACSSAGLNHDAENPLTAELLEWAELIFVMEKAQRSKLQARFGEHLHDKRVVCLNIPDNYRFMEPALVALLEKKVAPHLPA